MTLGLDANLLLYASDASSPHQPAALGFLELCARGPGLVAVPWPVAMAYLRISTHASIFESPLSPSEAEENLHGLLRRPHVRVLGAHEKLWSTYRELSVTTFARGKHVTDTWIAAILRCHGVTTLCTNDRDFARFDFLTVRNPLHE